MIKYITKSRVLLFTLGILCFVSVFLSTKCLAATETINDGASLLSGDEIADLEEQCNQIKTTYNTDMFIVTTNSTNGLTRKEYLSDYSDATGVNDTVLLLINMDSADRGFYIKSYGTAQKHLTNARIDNIMDQIRPQLKNASYREAMETFLNETSTYLKSVPAKEGLFYQLWFQIIVSLGIGGAIVLVMALNAGGKVTVNQETYLDNSTSRILAQHDHYIRTTLTKTKKQTNNNNGGDGISDSGRSSNGGGGSF